MKKTTILAALILAPALSWAEPYPEGDAAKGAKVFKKCVSCHMIGDGAKNRVGPHLNGIICRDIANMADYKFSKGMLAYA